MPVIEPIEIVGKDLKPSDCFWIDYNKNHRVVKEVIYSGGGFVGFRNYEGIYIVLTQCGREILVKQHQKILIKKRRTYAKKIKKVNQFAREARG